MNKIIRKCFFETLTPTGEQQLQRRKENMEVKGIVCLVNDTLNEFNQEVISIAAEYSFTDIRPFLQKAIREMKKAIETGQDNQSL